MASNQTKRTKAGTAARSRTSSAGSRSRPSGKKKTQKGAPPANYHARIFWGVVLLMLSVFSGLCWFHTDGSFIKLLDTLERGLFGWGWWVTPLCLFIASCQLIFARGRPVRLRVLCALLIPALAGACAHTLGGSVDYPLLKGGFSQLWSAAGAEYTGGVLGGTAAVVLSQVFSRAGALIMLWAISVGVIMLLTRTTPEMVGAWVLQRRAIRKERAHQRAEQQEEYSEEDTGRGGGLAALIPALLHPYDKEPEEEEPVQELEEEIPFQRTPPQAIVRPRRKKRIRDYDLEVDDPAALPVPAQAAAPKVETVKAEQFQPELLEDESAQTVPARAVPPRRAAKEGFFDRQIRVSTPDQYLAQEHAREVAPPTAPPEQPVPSQPTEPPAAAPTPKTEPSSKVPATPAAPAAPAEPVVLPEAPAKKEKLVPDQEVQQELELAVEAQVEEYQFPPVELLKNRAGISGADAGRELQETEELLADTLQSFGIEANIIEVTRGPSVTRYELELQRGVKLNKLTNLAADIALSLGAVSVRIAPIPGKNSVVGIEVPNRLVSPVPIRNVIDSSEFEKAKSQVAFAVGKDISNHNVIGDIARMPHLLIAGTTGSGKSVCTNSMIISLLYKSSPSDVKLIMIDPKMVELSNYNGIPHLLIPVVTDPKKAAGALQWAVNEMMRRYQDFARLGVREIASYNSIVRSNPELGEPKAKIVIFIDELADLMIAAAKEVEEAICRVAQMGRAAGMHLVIATQRPSSDVITGLMKANIPSRIALAVASSLDSRIILDASGAENLVGNGDMLFAPLGKPKRRVQGCFISDEEVNAVIEFVKSNTTPDYSDEVLQQVEENARNNEKGKKGAGGSAPDPVPEEKSGAPEDDRDPLYYDAVDVVVETGMASASMLQRRLKLGYSRAARLVDQMEEGGVVGPFEGSKPRKLLLTKEQWAEQKMRLGKGAGLDQSMELAKALSAEAEQEQPLTEGEEDE